MTNHDRIKNAFDDLKAPEDTAEKILMIAEEDSSNTRPARTGIQFKRPLVAAATACVGLILCVVTVFAVTKPEWPDYITNFFLKDVEPILQPVGGIASAENQGIRVEVLSALADDHSLLIKLQITDTTGNGRLTERTRINGSPPGGGISGVYITEYSPDVCTAYGTSSGELILQDNVHYQIDGIYLDGYPETGDNETHIWDLFFSVERTPVKYLENVQNLFDISLSPIGLYYRIDGPFDIEALCLELNMKDGQTIVFRKPQQGEVNWHSISENGSPDDPDHCGSINFNRIIPLDDVASVTLNGIEISL